MTQLSITRNQEYIGFTIPGFGGDEYTDCPKIYNYKDEMQRLDGANAIVTGEEFTIIFDYPLSVEVELHYRGSPLSRADFFRLIGEKYRQINAAVLSPGQKPPPMSRGVQGRGPYGWWGSSLKVLLLQYARLDSVGVYRLKIMY